MSKKKWLILFSKLIHKMGDLPLYIVPTCVYACQRKGRTDDHTIQSDYPSVAKGFCRFMWHPLAPPLLPHRHKSIEGVNYLSRPNIFKQFRLFKLKCVDVVNWCLWRFMFFILYVQDVFVLSTVFVDMNHPKKRELNRKHVDANILIESEVSAFFTW